VVRISSADGLDGGTGWNGYMKTAAMKGWSGMRKIPAAGAPELLDGTPKNHNQVVL
jgi:hypothetical protein